MATRALPLIVLCCAMCARPSHSAADDIRDNGFLVEEAANQGPDEVQHVLTFVSLFDDRDGSRTRDSSAEYTIELPLGSADHQLAVSLEHVSFYENPTNGPSTQDGGIGDTGVSYRYQLLADDDFVWAAPTIAFTLPTGDDRFGTGAGEVGYELALPVSSYGDAFDYHLNVGVNYLPAASVRLASGDRSDERDLVGFTAGASAFWKPAPDFHLFLEAFLSSADEIDEEGERADVTEVFLNPGFRYAAVQLEQVEWVLGLSIPVGVSDDAADVGAFIYLSVEHLFRRPPPPA